MAQGYVHPYARSVAYSTRVTPQRLRGSGGAVTMIGLPNKSGRGGATVGNAPIIGGTATIAGANLSGTAGGNLLAGFGFVVVVAAVLAYVGTRSRQF